MAPLERKGHSYIAANLIIESSDLNVESEAKNRFSEWFFYSEAKTSYILTINVWESVLQRSSK